MFVDEFLLISSAEVVAELRSSCEALGEEADGADTVALREIASAPPLEFSLSLTAHGERAATARVTDGEANGESESDAGAALVPLVGSILLRVRLPLDYPSTPPEFAVEDALITTQQPLEADKVLSTVAVLDEAALLAAMLERASESLPDPCVYEAVTWMTESAFEFVGQTWI